MGTRARSLIVMSVCAVVSSVSVAFLAGCPDNTPPPPSPTPDKPKVNPADLVKKAQATPNPLAAARLYLKACELYGVKYFSDANKSFDQAVAKLDEIALEDPSPAVLTELRADMAAVCFVVISEGNGRKHLAAAAEASKELGADAAAVRALARLGVAQHVLEDPNASTATLEKAATLAASLEDPVSQVTTLLDVARAYGETGASQKQTAAFDQANHLAGSMEDARKQSEALTWVALYQLDQANAGAAKGTIKKANVAAATLADPQPRANARIKMAELLLTRGQKQEAFGLLSQAEEDADKVKDRGQQKQLYQDVDRLRKQAQ